MGQDPVPLAGSVDSSLTCGDLSVGEQLVIWAIRTRLEGPTRLAEVREAFRLASDASTRRSAFRAFETWFLMVAAHCCRDLYLHRVCCPAISADEAAMLELVASRQPGGGEGKVRLAGRLVQADAIDLLLHASDALALALRELGLALPHRAKGALPERLH